MISTDSLAKLALSYGEMSNKKLQKVCYYIYSFYLAEHGYKLSNTIFEAWRHGPVSPIIYDMYKKYGWDNIPKYNGFLLVDSETINFAFKILEYYYKFTADELEDITHQELPWKKARKNLSMYESSNNIISDDDIKNYYKNHLLLQ